MLATFCVLDVPIQGFCSQNKPVDRDSFSFCCKGGMWAQEVTLTKFLLHLKRERHWVHLVLSTPLRSPCHVFTKASGRSSRQLLE